MGKKRSIETILLPVAISSVRTGVGWAEGPEDVPEYDWTQGVPPLEDPFVVLGEQGIGRVFEASPENLIYPRLVRRIDATGGEDALEGRASKPLPLQAVAVLTRVYRAVRGDQDPYRQGSPTRKAVGDAARKVGLLTSFGPGWYPFGLGVDAFFALYDDSLPAWVAAASFVHAFREALVLHQEGIAEEEVRQVLSDEMGLNEGDLRAYPDFSPQRAIQHGLDRAMRHFALLTRLGLSEYRERFQRELARRVVIRYRPPSWDGVSGIRLPPKEFLGRPDSGIHYLAYLSTLDLALLAVTFTPIKVCQYCGKLLTGKRRDARFCDDKCRVYFNRGMKRGFTVNSLALRDNEPDD